MSKSRTLSKKRYESNYSTYTGQSMNVPGRIYPSQMELCGHEGCYTRIEGIVYMLKGCLQVKPYVPKTNNKPMKIKYSKINKYLL